MFKYIADSKIELFLEKDLQFADLTVLRLLRYTIISFTLQLIGHTTTYCAGSLVEKIIIIVPFDMQSAYFLYFKSRHDMRHQQNFGDLLKQYTIGRLVNYDN